VGSKLIIVFPTSSDHFVLAVVIDEVNDIGVVLQGAYTPDIVHCTPELAVFLLFEPTIVYESLLFCVLVPLANAMV
jgi:hypothetical protein